MTDHTLMQLENYYTCYIEHRWHIYLTTLLLHRPVSVQCLNSTQGSTIIDDDSGGSDVGVASGIDRHPDRTEIYFRSQNIG